MKEVNYYASGKLLLFGEYLVLRGSKSLSIPLEAGQSLKIVPNNTNRITWDCFEGDHQWLHIVLNDEFEIVQTWDKEKAQIVVSLLKYLSTEIPHLKIVGNQFRFDINFHRHYGFGTSSTFISLLSQWSGIDPYILLERSFGGSGFDIATATAQTPIIYRMPGHEISPVHISENIQQHLLFIYTGKKQFSDKEVEVFKNIQTAPSDIQKMDKIIGSVVSCNDISEFESLMHQSEDLLSGILKYPSIKSSYFEDYSFAIKSLGAWGGDFIMATFRNENTARDYFKEKNYQPIFNYKQLIKHHG